jgi:hypothetical protein
MAVLEIVRFRTVADVSVEQMRAINTRFNEEETSRIPGLLRREAAVDDEGNWVVAVRFDTMEHAIGGPRPDRGAAASELLAAIDRSTFTVERFTIAAE